MATYKNINFFIAMVNSKLVVHGMQWQIISKLSLIVTYDQVSLEGKFLYDKTAPAIEYFRGIKGYKNFVFGWLLLNTLET